MNTKIPVCSQALAGLSSENGETPEQAELGAQHTQAWWPSLFAGLSHPQNGVSVNWPCFSWNRGHLMKQDAVPHRHPGLGILNEILIADVGWIFSPHHHRKSQLSSDCLSLW